MSEEELDLAKKTIEDLGFHWQMDIIEALGRVEYLKQAARVGASLRDMYFMVGKAQFRR